MNESFKILAEHFAAKEGLEVIVGGKDIYSEPGRKRIYLPENINDEMLDVVLAALLHESFHIRYTNCPQGYHGGSQPRDIALNALEDIRLDNRILKRYPNAAGLYESLFNYILKKVDLNKISFEVRVLREIIRISYNEKLFDVYKDTDPLVQDFISKHSQEITSILEETIKTKKTQLLAPLADKLVNLLFSEKYSQESQKMSSLQGEYGKSEQETKSLMQQALDLKKQISSMSSPLEDLEARKRQQEQEINNCKSNENFYKEKSQDPYATPSNRERAGSLVQQYKDRAKEAEIAKEILENKIKEFPGIDREKLKELHAELSKKGQEQRAEEAKLWVLSSEMSKASKELTKKISDDMKDYHKTSISFSNIDAKDLEISKILVKFSQSLQEHFMDFLKNKKERSVHTEEGKINSQRLPTYHDASSLFERNPVDRLEKTRVFFLVDRSGSMSSGGKYQSAYNSVSSITRILERSIDEGLDLEYSVYSFDDSPCLIKDFNEPLDFEKLGQGLIPRGGTTPIHTFKAIEKIDPDKFGTKEFVFFITDGEIDTDSQKYVENNLNDKRKWIFLGISINDNDDFSKRFFGRYNIKDANDIEPVLIRAIEDNI